MSFSPLHPAAGLPRLALPGIHLQGELLLHGDSFGGAFAIHRYVPPNAISTLLIGGLSSVLDPFLAGRIFIFLSAALIYFGIYYFLRLTIRKHDILLASIAFLFVFNYSFWLGNLSFLFGFGAALLGIYLLIQHKWIESIPLAALLFLICYLSHFFSWFFILYAAGIYILLEKRYHLIKKIGLAAIPTLILFVHYLFAKGPGEILENPSLPLPEIVRLKLLMVAGAILPIQRYKGLPDPDPAFVILNYLFLAAIAVVIVLGLWWAFRRRRHRHLLVPHRPYADVRPYGRAARTADEGDARGVCGKRGDRWVRAASLLRCPS
jgi:hypothetical protein